jgi:ZIP family zinc transporter
MGNYAIPFMATLFAFGGLLLGGTVGVVTKQVMTKRMYHLYAFSGGVLFGLLGLELVPETFTEYPPIGPLLGVGIGFLLMILVHTYFHHHKSIGKEQEAFQAFLFLSLAICIHNIPTGMAFGSVLVHNEELAFTFLLAIVFHHIPEGLSLMIPFLFTRSTFSSFLGITLLLSAVLGLGTLLGGLVQGESMPLQGVVMGMAIGTLGYVALCEMLLKAKKQIKLVSFLTFALSGFVMVKAYVHIFMEH